MKMLAILGLTIVVLGHLPFAGTSPVAPDVLDMLRAIGQDIKLAELLGIKDVRLLHAKEKLTEGPFLSNAVTPDVLDMLRATGQDEKLAELLGIEDVSLLHANKERSADPFLSNVSPLGDILLTREQTEQARQGINFRKYRRSKWRNNVIPYHINPDDFSNDQQNKIHKALEDLSNRLKNLKIRRYQSSDNDYVYVISGSGCYANLGRIGDRQTVSLKESGCLQTGIIQHEFIHAAGMQHEHNRPDRDIFVRVIEENIPSRWQSQYTKGSSEDYDILGDYDHYSVMHYRYNAPGTNKPAFEVYNKNVNTRNMGQRKGPTNTDLQKIDKLYS